MPVIDLITGTIVSTELVFVAHIPDDIAEGSDSEIIAYGYEHGMGLAIP